MASRFSLSRIAAEAWSSGASAWDPKGDPWASPSRSRPASGMRSASLSPDGTKLAYSRGREVANVWRVPILNRLATWLTPSRLRSMKPNIEFVDVSPDAESLAISSDRGGNQDLWILSSEGGEMTQLTRHIAHDWSPRWSPDGKEIVFTSFRSGNRDIWVMPSEGGPAPPAHVSSRSGPHAGLVAGRETDRFPVSSSGQCQLRRLGHSSRKW